MRRSLKPDFIAKKPSYWSVGSALIRVSEEKKKVDRLENILSEFIWNAVADEIIGSEKMEIFRKGGRVALNQNTFYGVSISTDWLEEYKRPTRINFRWYRDGKPIPERTLPLLNKEKRTFEIRPEHFKEETVESIKAILRDYVKATEELESYKKNCGGCTNNTLWNVLGDRWIWPKFYEWNPELFDKVIDQMRFPEDQVYKTPLDEVPEEPKYSLDDADLGVALRALKKKLRE